MALPGHVTTEGHQDGGPEPELLGAKDGSHDHVLGGLDTAVCSQPNTRPQTVHHQRLLRLRQAQLPGTTSVLDRRQGRSAGAAGVAADQDVVGACFGHSSSDRTDARLGDQLHPDPGPRVDLPQVINQLRQVFDRVDVVVRRR